MKQMNFFIIASLALLFLLGCTEKYPNKTESSTPVLGQSNCEVCHLDKELLKEVADPLPPAPPSDGEG
jgi:outer membrane biogenesis lipoprotein LolB